MGFENPAKSTMRNFDQKHQSPEFLHPLVAEAYKKTQEIIKSDAIDPNNFVPRYGKAVVMNDIRYVASQQAEFKRGDKEKGSEINKKYADVFEGILYQQIELSDWFGPSASTIKTSLYDDYKNGVDLIVEMKDDVQENSYLGLAIDVTFGTTAMQKKFDAIREEILSGKLTQVKYFESEHSSLSPNKSPSKKLPRVVIGVEREHIIELAAMWLDPKRKKELASNPLQKVILQEIASQLEGFREFAKTGSAEAAALVPIFDRELSIIQKILVEKQALRSERFRDDRVVGAIEHQIKSL